MSIVMQAYECPQPGDAGSAPFYDVMRTHSERNDRRFLSRRPWRCFAWWDFPEYLDAYLIN